MFRMQRTSGGYTLVELVTVISVFSLIVITFGITLTSSYGSAFESKARSLADVSLQNAMDVIEKDVRYSTGFNNATSAPYYDIYGPGTVQIGGSGYIWNYRGSSPNSRTLILSNNASTARSRDNTRRPLFVNQPFGLISCMSGKEYLPKLQYRTIYFVRDRILYRRIVTDTSTSLCAGQPAISQKQSCPREAFAGTKPAVCKARDEAIARNVNKFTVKYYQNITTPIANQYATGSEDLSDAEHVEVSLTVSMPPSSKTRTSTLLITRIN